jgi:hypothetical protein
MARTDSERLTLWLDLRDSIEDAIAAGIPILRYRIGNREVEREPTAAWLREVNSIISSLQEATAVGTGPIRNLIQLTRYPR